MFNAWMEAKSRMVKSKLDYILDTFFYLIIILLVGFLIIVLFLGIQDYKTDFEKICREECYKFDYSFYKTENPGLFQRYNCWCLKDNQPKNIGNIEVPENK